MLLSIHGFIPGHFVSVNVKDYQLGMFFVLL